MLTDSARRRAKANHNSLDELTTIARLTGKTRKWMLSNLKTLDEVLSILKEKGWIGLVAMVPEFGPQSAKRLYEVLVAAGHEIPELEE
ncbi:MAG: hypothetical protein AAB443_01070 [Patescibacteria group bacterium]